MKEEANKELGDKRIVEAEGQALLEELDAEVAHPPVQLGVSHGGSPGSCLATERTILARIETSCLHGLNMQVIQIGMKTEEVRQYDLGHRKICEAKEETWIAETPGPSVHLTTNAICDDLELAQPRMLAQ